MAPRWPWSAPAAAAPDCRAIYKNPAFVFFDEATSSLDANTEAVIADGLRGFLKERTALSIAHRLSTVRHADRIAVLAAGRCVESGTHEELLGLDGTYANLVRKQMNPQSASPDAESAPALRDILSRPPSWITSAIVWMLLFSAIGLLALAAFLKYPPDEFGSLTGTVRSRSAVANEENYLVVVELPEGMKTNLGKTLPFQPDMRGQAQIITNSRSILERALQLATRRWENLQEN